VFRGERDDVLKPYAELIEKHPLVKALIISGDALPVARLKVKEPGTAHYANYQKLSRELLDEAREKAKKEEAMNNA